VLLIMVSSNETARAKRDLHLLNAKRDLADVLLKIVEKLVLCQHLAERFIFLF